MLNKEEQSSDLLQKKPQRQTGWRLMPFLMLPGMIIILGVVLVGAWRITNSAPSSTGSSAQNTGNTGNRGTSNSQTPGDNHPAVYWQTLRVQFAQGMHMTEQQIQENVQSTLLATHPPTTNGRVELNAADAAQWVSDLATARGISQNQLHTIEVTAVQRAYAVLVEQHVLTQQQANEDIQGMSQDDLNDNIMSAFVMCSTGKASCQE
jgi:hypothetical protein